MTNQWVGLVNVFMVNLFAYFVIVLKLYRNSHRQSTDQEWRASKVPTTEVCSPYLLEEH